MADLTKTEQDGQHPAAHYLVVQDPAHVATWHLRVKDVDGKPDHRLMGAAKAALTGGYRGQKYDGPDKAAALDKLKALYTSEGMAWDAKPLSDLMQVFDLSRVALTEAPNGLTRTPIAAIGTWVKGGDEFSITARDLADIYANFQKLGTDGRSKDDVVVDYNHATVAPELSQGGEAPAAGWLRELEPPQAGAQFLWGLIEFTDRARQAIAAKEYKYLSPVIVWGYPDKRSGATQGTTVTSLALTNIPFLDELPAICLTDRGYVPAPPPAEPERRLAGAESAATSGKEKKHMAKKVKVTPIKSGDNAGHLKISHPDLPDDSDFYANKNDVAEALDDAQAMDEKSGEQLSEATGLKGKRLSEQLPAVKARFAAKVIALADLPQKADGPDKGAPDFARFEPGEGTLVAAEVFRAMAAEQVLDEAVRAKKILPKERTFLRKLSLSDLREYLSARTSEVVETGERGFAGTGTQDATTAKAAHDTAVRKVLAEKRPGVSTYGAAMKVVAAEQPEVRRAYDLAQGIRKSA